MARSASMLTFSAARLAEAFESFSPLLRSVEPTAGAQLSGIPSALESLSLSLAKAGAPSEIVSIWAIAGINRDETRNAKLLAGLWMYEFHSRWHDAQPAT